MSLTIEQIAKAFSSHEFKVTYPYFLDDIQWILVGEKELNGKEEVISICEQSAIYLSEVTTKFSKFKAVVGESSVVIDSLAEYLDKGNESSIVASCDIYDFINGNLSKITSYTIELTQLRSQYRDGEPDIPEPLPE